MKNRLIDLNNHLFAQIERLSDENLTDAQVGTEVKRTEAIVSISKEIIANADLSLKGARIVAEHGAHLSKYLPLMIEGAKEGQKE